jgi:MobA/MobL family
MAIYSLRLSSVGKTTQKQPFTAAAHMKYVTRKAAVTHVVAARMPEVRRQAIAWLRHQERDDRKNARVIDKVVLALPRELTNAHRYALVKAFAEELTQGRASWFAAFHMHGKDTDNPHCHLILRDRDVETGKRVMFLSAGKKEAALRRDKGQAAPTGVREIRALWEQCANAALQVAGRTERIDRRTLAAQGVRRNPQVHEGPNIRAMHARDYRPKSRDRVAWVRGGRRQAGAQRVVRWAEIDRGLTRVEYNAALRAEARASVVAAERAVRNVEVQEPVVVPVPMVEMLRSVAWRRSPDTPPVPVTVAAAPPPGREWTLSELFARESGEPEVQPRSDQDRSSGTDGRKGSVIAATNRLADHGTPIYLRVMDTELDHLQADIDAARATYRAERDLLVRMAGWIYADGPSAADAIESLADELGPGQAVEQLLALPQVFGELGPTASDQVIADQSDELEPMLERLLDAQDRLDILTRQREDVLAEREPGRLRVLNIGGREFAVDRRADEVRSVNDSRERHALAEDGVSGRTVEGAALTLTEQFARETGAGKAEPKPELGRTRG